MNYYKTILPKEDELIDLKVVKDLSSYSQYDKFICVIYEVIEFKERL